MSSSADSKYGTCPESVHRGSATDLNESGLKIFFLFLHERITMRLFLNPMIARAAMTFSPVSVIANALRLRRSAPLICELCERRYGDMASGPFNLLGPVHFDVVGDGHLDPPVAAYSDRSETGDPLAQ